MKLARETRFACSSSKKGINSFLSLFRSRLLGKLLPRSLPLRMNLPSAIVVVASLSEDGVCNWGALVAERERQKETKRKQEKKLNLLLSPKPNHTVKQERPCMDSSRPLSTLAMRESLTLTAP